MVNQGFKDKFEGSKSIGKIGEQAVREFIESKWKGMTYKDMSEVEGYQYKEVDAVLEFESGRNSVAIEIKTDTWSNMPNLAIETIANEEIGRPGWIWTTEADWIVYLFVNGLDSGEDNLWFIDVEHIRTLIRSNPNLKGYQAPVELQVFREGNKTTKGVRLPRKMVTPLATYKIPPLNLKNPHSSRRQ